MNNTFRFVDLFCGGGGSVTGAINAMREAGLAYDGRAFNHWDLAIRTISANHPEIVPDHSRACASIEHVLPDEIFSTDPQRIDFLWASPSCTHHSIAAGGKPRSNQLRSQPEYLLPYLRLTRVRRVFVENVRELRDWGPVLDDDTTIKGQSYKAGQPDPRRKGAFFELWLKEIKASGYHVDMAIMNAADYGAATSRERLIIQAVRKSSGERIAWPEQTHALEQGLFGYSPWRTAADIIDWSIRGESIFNRRRPLCENTLRRIEAGIRKYWGESAEPFLIRYNGGDNRIHAVTDPLPVIDTSNRYGLVQPLFVPQHSGGEVRPVTFPLSTIATTGSIGLVRPFLVQYYGSGVTASIDQPINTITTRDRFGLIQGLPGLDITHRMLTTAELAAATGFPDGYQFAGSDTAAKKQIGNAVCPDLAQALYRAAMAA